MSKKTLRVLIGGFILAFAAVAGAMNGTDTSEMPKDAIGWICPPICGG